MSALGRELPFDDIKTGRTTDTLSKIKTGNACVRVHVMPVNGKRTHIFEIGSNKTLCGAHFLGFDVTQTEAKHIGVCKRCAAHNAQFPAQFTSDAKVIEHRAKPHRARVPDGGDKLYCCRCGHEWRSDKFESCTECGEVDDIERSF